MYNEKEWGLGMIMRGATILFVSDDTNYFNSTIDLVSVLPDAFKR